MESGCCIANTALGTASSGRNEATRFHCGRSGSPLCGMPAHMGARETRRTHLLAGAFRTTASGSQVGKIFGASVFPSSQRRAPSASPIGRSLKKSCAELSEGADGVVGAADTFRRADHPGAPASIKLSRHPSSARRGILQSSNTREV